MSEQSKATVLELSEAIAPNYEYGAYDVDCLYEIFNENAKYFRPTVAGIGMRINDFLSNPQTIRLHLAGVKRYESFPLLALPPAQSLPSQEFASVLHQRRSRPEFGRSISQQELADLLGNALGCNASMTPEYARDATLHRKPYPSGGGLYPVEFYVLPMRVDGVQPCVCHYNTISRELRVLQQELQAEQVNRVLSMPFAADKMPAVMIFMSGVLQRSTNKYGNKGYKLVMIEAGAAGQTLHLNAQALGLHGLMWSSFFDDEAERLLQLDGVSESVIVGFFAG
ncbi:SagB family peptide dehydrogenase [Massilia sp. W12]|uniref:SagB family peptide dehydrogenase n=1 Tax=Massilia sp. W12 TaxID=3126507 RepID=UPI0030CEE4ED